MIDKSKHNKDLYSHLCDRNLLQAMWEEIDAKNGDNDPASVLSFAKSASVRLDKILGQLENNSYRPHYFHSFAIEKKSGEPRILMSSTIADRIVEKSILSIINPLIDPIFLSCSYAYRPGIGTNDAISQVVELREMGYNYVLRSDIDDCFPNINKTTALRLLFNKLPDDSLNRIIHDLVYRKTILKDGKLGQTRGLPQGSPLAPIMMNVVLHELDEKMCELGYNYVRYADDFVVVCETKKEAKEAMDKIEKILNDKDLVLSEDKTEIMSFDDGFTFLGEDFGPRYPPYVPDLRLEDNLNKVLYIGRQGTRIRKTDGRLIVESSDDVELMNVPQNVVERLVLFGSVGVTAGVRNWAYYQGVDMCLCLEKGII